MEHWLTQEYQFRGELFSEQTKILIVSRKAFNIPGEDTKISKFIYFICIKKFII